MDRFLKGHGPILIALGAGLAIGTGSTVMYYQVSRNISKEVAQLATKLENLCQDVKSLRRIIENITQGRRTRTDYFSVNASSGEDDDEYEEAIDDETIRYTVICISGLIPLALQEVGIAAVVTVILFHARPQSVWMPASLNPRSGKQEVTIICRLYVIFWHLVILYSTSRCNVMMTWDNTSSWIIYSIIL